jgi:hypothetical protein
MSSLAAKNPEAPAATNERTGSMTGPSEASGPEENR